MFQLPVTSFLEGRVVHLEQLRNKKLYNNLWYSEDCIIVTLGMFTLTNNICAFQVEEVVETGEIPPEQVHVPGIYIDRIISGEKYEKRIEVVV